MTSYLVSHVVWGLLITMATWDTRCTGCPEQLDLVLVVDSSGSIDAVNFNILLEFLVQVTERFPIGLDQTRVSVVRFATQVDILWGLGSDVTSSRGELEQGLMSIEHTRGKTNTAGALDTVMNQVLNSPGDREDVPNLVVVITDGRSNLGSASLSGTATVLKEDTRVVSIGVTDEIDWQELFVMASSQCDIFHVYSFDAMDDDMDSTIHLICGCSAGSRRVLRFNVCSCEDCSGNTYQPEWGQAVCLDCPPGTQAREDGADKCTETCNAGQRFEPESESCQECEAGYYQSRSDTLTESCTRCDNGLSTRSTGSHTQSDCEVLCEAGQRPDRESNTCEDCPRGTYQPYAYSDSCLVCPEGTSTAVEGATSREQCTVDCEPGEMYNRTAATCQPCPQGSYQPNKYALECVPCDEDLNTLYTGARAASECIYTCGPGQELREDTDECFACKVGFYQPDMVGVLCEPCPEGTSTQGEGGTQCTAVQGQVGSESDDKSGNAGLIAGVVVAVLLLVALGVVLLVCFLVRRKRNKEPSLSNLFVVPTPDKSHIYKDASQKGEYSKPSNVYDNSAPIYDVPTKSATPLPLQDDTIDPVYNNAMMEGTPPIVQDTSDHVYSNTAGVKGAGIEQPGYGLEGGEGLDNPLYENQEELGITQKP